MNRVFDTETILDDDYPVFLDYWYVCDGIPKRCPLFGMDGDNPTVRDLRRALQCEEVRRCDILARQNARQNAVYGADVTQDGY